MVQGKKKGASIDAPLSLYDGYLLSQKMIVTPCPVGKNRGVENLTATGAFPGIEGSHVIIKLFIEHTTFAFRTFHDWYPPKH